MSREHPGAERVCVGWLANQLGPGNNLPLRLWASRNLTEPLELVGEQHETFEDTLPPEDDVIGKPYPAPLDFNLIDGGRTIEHKGHPVATVHTADDFPCLDDDECEQTEADLNATGRKLVTAYNTHDEAVDWLRRFLSASVHVADDTGILARYREEGLALLGRMLPDGASTN